MDYTGRLPRPPCETCNSTGWVCENDHIRPWADEPGCGAVAILARYVIAPPAVTIRRMYQA
jgi:hypothetical protein